MQNKLLPLQVITSIACLAIAMSLYWIFKAKPNAKPTEQIATVTNSEFTKNNANKMVVDTFKYLVTKAYAGFSSFTQTNGILNLSIKGAGALTKDFYNGNENLLKWKLKDYGFEIVYLPMQNSIEAKFAITDNGVVVPNDVVIKLASKTYKKKM
jgi:hypothetical protein